MMSLTANIPQLNMALPLEDEDAFKEGALRVLKIIRPAWDHRRVHFKAFTAGITNKILCASYSPANCKSHEECLLFRVYGNNTSKIIDRQKEFNNWRYLASCGCSAQLYASFLNGVVSGFLPGSTLTVDSIRDEAIITNICKELAKMHKLKPNTGDKTKPALFVKINQYLEIFSDNYQDECKQQQYDSFFKLQNICFQHDLHLLREAVYQHHAVIVFCHNDLLIHNIIHNEQTGVEDFDYSRCPDEHCKRLWTMKYLTYFLERVPGDDEVEALLRSIDTFEAAAHFFWALWALVQSHISTIHFDYLNYAIQRYKRFQQYMAKCDSG